MRRPTTTYSREAADHAGEAPIIRLGAGLFVASLALLTVSLACLVSLPSEPLVLLLCALGMACSAGGIIMAVSGTREARTGAGMLLDPLEDPEIRYIVRVALSGPDVSTDEVGVGLAEAIEAQLRDIGLSADSDEDCVRSVAVELAPSVPVRRLLYPR